jgi:hypothetical protein
MRILVKPEELVRLCLWDNYTYYILGSDKDAEKMLLENNEFEIQDRDALVIGLLKILETTNLIHKFNSFLMDLLTNKSVSYNDQVLIKKKVLESAIEKFLDKFPDYWVPDIEYKNALTDLIKYSGDFKANLDKLNNVKITDQFGTYDSYTSQSVKKLLKFNF